MNTRFKLTLIYIVIFMTGLSGLVFQVTWQKYLSRLLGSDSFATAIILGTFLGGLSIGYFICGKITTMVNNHFKCYAILEGIIGIWSLLFPIIIFNFVENMTLLWSFKPPVLMILQGVFCSFLLIGVPTICMGGTIPFLTRGISKNITEATKVHANVYAINTAGAFVGTLLAGFYLIPEYGLPLTLMQTAMLNIMAFIFFFFISFKTLEVDPSKIEPINNQTLLVNEPDLKKIYLPSVLYMIAFLSGFYVMTLENVLIRVINLSFGSSSYSFSLIVSVFILSIAIGSYVIGKVQNIKSELLFLNQLGILILLFLIYVTLDQWPYWAHIIRIMFQSHLIGFWGYYLAIFMAFVLVFLIPIGLMGATVPIAFHELKQDLKAVGKHSGFLLSLNTLGNLTGSIIGGVVFYYFIDIPDVFFSSVFLAGISTYLASVKLSFKYKMSSILLLCFIILFSLYNQSFNKEHFILGTFRIRMPISFSLDGAENFFQKFNQNNNCLFYKDGPVCSVRVSEEKTIRDTFNKKARSIIVNGKSDSSTIGDITTIKLSAHIPALFADSRKNSFIIGLGTGVTAGELAMYPDAETIDVAEISPYVIKSLPFFSEFTGNVEKNPKVRIHEGDALRILKRSRKKWDIITSEPSNPWVIGNDLLFTKDFYELVKSHLADSGIFLQWVQTYEATPKLPEIVLKTIKQIFENVHVFVSNTSDLLIVVSNKPFSLENIEKAKQTFESVNLVKESLSDININSIESLLMREILSPMDIDSVFFENVINTMDNPILHYIAGKSFFYGQDIPLNFYLRPESAAHKDHLFDIINPQWNNFDIPINDYGTLIKGLTERDTEQELYMAQLLKLKAHLTDPVKYPLTIKEQSNLNIDLINIISGKEEKPDWKNVGLENMSYSQKSNVMTSHLIRTRNWISPYPVIGLKKLLSEGMEKGVDAYEKNICAFLMLNIQTIEKEPADVIIQTLKKITKDSNGKVILKDEDLPFVQTVIKKLIRYRNDDAFKNFFKSI